MRLLDYEADVESAVIGSPCAANGTPDRDEAEACFVVCGIHNTCCDVERDEACLPLASEICGTCGDAA